MERKEEVVNFLKLHPDAIIPKRGTEYSAAFDLYALKDVLIVGGAGNFLVPTGISVTLPAGTYGRIAMRSGLAKKEHLTVTAGVIDIDYTGPLGVLVSSTKILDLISPYTVMPHTYKIEKGERFAQLIVERVCYAPGAEIFSTTTNNMPAHVGYGSTGTN